jgi:hypothetical protein
VSRNGEIDEAPAAPPARPDEDGPMGRTDEWPDDRAGRDPGDLVSGLSPRQIIGGFALLAGLILMIRRSRRKKG